ncbi:MAG: hypothetical protein J07HN6_01889, partial [Halonotius sp. J07HN6]
MDPRLRRHSESHDSRVVVSDDDEALVWTPPTVV